jgi:hypothetical protein
MRPFVRSWRKLTLHPWRMPASATKTMLDEQAQRLQRVEVQKASSGEEWETYALEIDEKLTVLTSSLAGFRQDDRGRGKRLHRMNEDEDLVALRKGFGDAFMFVAVSVSQAKLPLPGILPPAHRNHRPDLIVRGERVTPFDCAEQRGERLRFDGPPQGRLKPMAIDELGLLD